MRKTTFSRRVAAALVLKLCGEIDALERQGFDTPAKRKAYIAGRAAAIVLRDRHETGSYKLRKKEDKNATRY